MVVLNGDGYTLRPLSIFDLDGYFDTMKNGDTIAMMNEVPKTREKAQEDIKNFLEKVASGVSEYFTIVVDGNYAGNIVLEHNNFTTHGTDGRLHIWVHPAYRGRRIATAALKQVIDYGFKKKYTRIFAQCKAENKVVEKVNVRLGFTRVDETLLKELQKEPQYAKLEITPEKILWVLYKPSSLFARLMKRFRR